MSRLHTPPPHPPPQKKILSSPSSSSFITGMSFSADDLAGMIHSRKAPSKTLGPELCGLSDYIRTGLCNSATRVQTSRNKYGANEIALPPLPSYWSRLELDPTLKLLTASAFASLILGMLRTGDDSNGATEGLSVLLTVAVVVNLQAYTNYRKAAEFRKQHEELENRKSINVIRDGNIAAIHPRLLVVGDVVRLVVGTVVPADGVVIAGSVNMDESAMTGESKPINRVLDACVLSGTNVMKGEALLLVLAVGPRSVSGKILNTIVEEAAESTSVLFRKLDSLAVNVGKAGMLCAIFIFFALVTKWMFREYYGDNGPRGSSWDEILESFLEFFITSMTVLVVAVPEGLPLAVTLALAVSLDRLLKDGNQVKQFESAETMGSATTICTDKTGTLTENRMKVVRSSLSVSKTVPVLERTYSTGPILSAKPPPSLTLQKDFSVKELFAMCCSLVVSADSKIKLTNKGNFQYEGNPTECALLRYCSTVLDTDYFAVQQMYHDASANNGVRWGVHANPFSSERKMMSVVIRQADGRMISLVKGAPLILMEKCSRMAVDLNSISNTTKVTKKIRATAIQAMQGEEEKACRVIAFAYKLDIHDVEHESETDLTFLGWCALEDALRHGVVEAVGACQNAGVVVRMITGDSYTTAKAVAVQCGILDRNISSDYGEYSVMTGAEFDERVHKLDVNPNVAFVTRRTFDFATKTDAVRLSPPFLLDERGRKVLDEDAFDHIWPQLRVMARCEPSDKFALVKGIRKSRLYLKDPSILPQVVAVTGDGTNDAPSLKTADVGFAMGISGTDVAKQAADIIVLDDSFNSIVRALVWGRNVHDSVCKFIQFQMTVNLVAVISALVGAIVLSKSPLTATQMLWVNMIMDSLGSLALATSRPDEERVLSRRPISKYDPVIDGRMIVNIVGQAVMQLFFFWYYSVTYGPSIKDDTSTVDATKLFYTKFFNIFVLFQLFNEINSKSISGSVRERFNFSGSLLFVVVWVGTLGTQFIIVQYGGRLFSCVPLRLMDWVFCIGIGSTSIVWQIVFVDPIARRVSQRSLDKQSKDGLSLESSKLLSKRQSSFISVGSSSGIKPRAVTYGTLGGSVLASSQSAPPPDGSDFFGNGASKNEIVHSKSMADAEDLFKRNDAKRRWGLVRSAIMLSSVMADSVKKRQTVRTRASRSFFQTLDSFKRSAVSLNSLTIDEKIDVDGASQHITAEKDGEDDDDTFVGDLSHSHDSKDDEDLV